MDLFETFVEDYLLVVFWITPLFFLLQAGAFLLLLWQVGFRWSPDNVGIRRPGRWLLQSGVVVAPVVMLFVSAAFTTDFQDQYGHWFFSIHDEWAGWAMLPFYVAGSVIVWRGFARRELALSSGLHLVVLWIMTGICVWHAFATRFLNLLTDSGEDLGFLAIIPAIAAANYAMRAVDIVRHGKVEEAAKRSVKTWFSALAVTIVVKALLAMRFYASLPVERPSGYGDCFVVSAAAQGHKHIVRSEYDGHLGRTVNKQWHTLRTFENHLVKHQPTFHSRLRHFYNYIGPPIATCIRSPFVADLMYLLLKPIEWLARLYLFISKRS
jgi:hypothetical protein